MWNEKKKNTDDETQKNYYMAYKERSSKKA